MAWEVVLSNGIYLPQIDWRLDARAPAVRSFVSHAHSDHIGIHREVLCSEPTARLMAFRLGATARRNEIILPFGEPHALTGGVSATLHPAGHMLGSSQLLLESGHGRLLYTGDFKLRSELTAEPCATPPADLLIMETTYGLPRYRFPSAAQVLEEIIFFCREALDQGDVPVLLGYSLGKSQRLLQGLSNAGLPLMLHREPFRLTQVYQQLGVVFPPYQLLDASAADGYVVISPPLDPGTAWLRRLRHRRTAVITGWAVDPGTPFRYRCDAAFPLSDHADFWELLEFVERVNPSRVLTVHGFAREFAAELRSRGLEAWALGSGNQLEFAISVPQYSQLARPAAISQPPPPTSPPDAFCRWVETAESVRRTPKKLEKISALSDYLRTLDAAEAARAALFFTGRPFAQASGRALGLGWASIRGALLDVAGAEEAAFRAAYDQVRDIGEAVECLLQGKPVAVFVSLAEIEAWLHRLAGERGLSRKTEILRDLFRLLSAPEAKYLVKIVTGDLRIGLKEGLVEEAIAAAFERSAEAVREANLLCGDISAVALAAHQDRLAHIELRVFHPLQFMLASAEPTAQGIIDRLGSPVWLEEKYDGIRCQVHKQGARVELYSRDLRPITSQFPDLAACARQVPADFIADGELVGWRGDRVLPFAELQKRLGRQGDDLFLNREIPVSLYLYDLLWVEGESLLRLSLSERRGRLEALSLPPEIRAAPVGQAEDAVGVEAAFLRARERGNEGLVAKDPKSPYTPGRRGLAWLKLKKAYATLDVVVVAAEYGHGKRRHVLSDYTFAVRDPVSSSLLTVGKAYSGLTDAEIAGLTAHFLEHTLETHGRYHRVQPDTVLEVAFDTIQPSKRHNSGYALRFPRILRIRTDKSPDQIDTVETCRRLAAVAAPAQPELF